MRADRLPATGLRRATAALVLLWAGAVSAQESGAGFAALAAEQRALLAPFQAHWERLGEAQRQTLIDNAERWRQLDPLAQARLQQRLREWLALPAEARLQLRDRYALWAALPADRRAALLAQAAAHAALPEIERMALRERFAALPVEQRRALLQDPQAQALAQLARQVFAFVPADQREVTLAMLDGLGAAERDLLRRLSRRLAPWQREALRVELLRLPAGQRAAYLRQRS